MEKATILVIEDNPVNMKLVRKLLQLNEYAVLEASEAKTGIQLAKQHKPALILMDIQLPGMDGLGATACLKADPDVQNIPVVALTAHAMRRDYQKAKEAGCDGYIIKPIDTRNFLKTVSGFLKKTRHHRARSERRDLHHRNRVLVFDDTALNAQLLAEKFPTDDYEIVTALYGEDALEKVHRELPDLIVLDNMVSDLDGTMALVSIKADPKTENIPIILVTTPSGKGEKEKAIEAGIHEFINKPVNRAELMARTSSLLFLRHCEEQLSVRRQSEAWFSAPASEDEASGSETAFPSIVLLADSEKDTRLVQNYLRDQPFRLLVATGAEEALSLVQREKTACALLDVLAMETAGPQVCRDLKKACKSMNIPVVVIASLQDLEDKAKNIELGVDDYLIKPMNAGELRARLNTTVQKKRYLDRLSSHGETAAHATMRDGSTGLHNHVYLKRFLEFEVRRSVRHTYPVGLTIISIEDFPHHVSALGRAASEELVRALAHVVQSNIREIDLAARYRDDALAVVLPYCERRDVVPVAERICTAFASTRLPYDLPAAPGSVTLNVGVAFYPPDASTAEELIQNAQSMLRRAREEGKNRVCVYG